ncbi:MAG: hypothetical protein IJT25_01155, partial [Clostridia bacterium]|nr:hypothetical protein [Clostridia bacterium]
MKKFVKIFAILVLAIVPMMIFAACNANGSLNFKVKDAKLMQSSFVYDGTEKQIAIKEDSLPQNVVVKAVEGDSKATNAGNYVARIQLAYKEGETELATIELEFPWQITKSDLNVNTSEIALEETAFTYNRNNHVVSVNEETLPDNIEVDRIENGVGRFAGEYQARIFLRYIGEGAQNYNPIAPIYRLYTINKDEAPVAPNAVEFNQLTYNGQTQTATVNPASIEGFEVVSISGNTAKEAGEYNATLALRYVGADAQSYNTTVFEDIEASFVIDKAEAPVVPSAIEFNELTYNGQIQTATVNSASIEGFEVASISGNTAKEAGEYSATLALRYIGTDAESYKTTLFVGVGAKYVINKATLQFPSISLVNDEMVYNKIPQQALANESTLEENFIVANIVNNEATEEGNYTAIITLLYVGEDADNYTSIVKTVSRNYSIIKTIEVESAEEYVLAFATASEGNGVVININADLDLSNKAMVVVSSDTTINLNGHTLNAGLNGDYSRSILQVVNDATLTINGTEEGSKVYG